MIADEAMKSHIALHIALNENRSSIGETSALRRRLCHHKMMYLLVGAVAPATGRAEETVPGVKTNLIDHAVAATQIGR